MRRRVGVVVETIGEVGVGNSRHSARCTSGALDFVGLARVVMGKLRDIWYALRSS